MKGQQVEKHDIIRAVLAVAIVMMLIIHTAMVSSRQQGQERTDPEEGQKAIVELQVRCRKEEIIEQKGGLWVSEYRPDEFPEWVKPQVEGMVPVYGRETIDYISLDDFECMAKVVYAEAKAEVFEGQVAVAEVIINRVESENFPDTVEGVIKQDGAFSSWGNGMVTAAPLDDECLEAVQEAVNRRTFPDTIVYFREGFFHPFGAPYKIIGNHYFSSERR